MSDHDERRRRFVRDSGLLVGAAAGGLLRSGIGRAVPNPREIGMPDERTLTRIAFGSCAQQDKDQPIWDAVLAARPDLSLPDLQPQVR